MKILVIIPTYNEKENIQKLVEKILNLNLILNSQFSILNILIIDDNSPDGTGEIADVLAKKYSEVKVIHRQGKRSEGLSRRDGYRYALEHNYDYIFEMDADLSHKPEEIPKFLEQIRYWDVIIGSRFIKGSRQVGRSIFRRLGSRLANFYIRKMLKIENIYDCASGYRCYRREVLERINLDDISFTPLEISRRAPLEMSHRDTVSLTGRDTPFLTGFTGPASLIKTLFKCYKLGFKIKEVPITYREREFGKSKKKSIGFIIEALWTVFKLKYHPHPSLSPSL